MALILSGTDGVSDVDGTAATPAVRGADTNTGIFFPAADTIAFAEGGVEVARITNTAAWSFGSSGTATGTSGQVLTSAGSGAAPTWAAVAGVISNYQEFLSSGTWTKPAGATYVYVEAIGGGGGARSAAFSGDNCQGGGGGEFTSMIMRAADVTSTVTVTVGAGGAGGPIGGDTGSAGGDSTFGVYVTGRGGLRGGGGLVNEAFTGLPGGGGNINNPGGAVYPQAAPGGAPNQGGMRTIYGGGGGAGITSTARTGGTSLYGGNGGNSIVSGAGQNGSQPGGGGGATGSSSFAAGSGGAGRVRVYSW